MREYMMNLLEQYRLAIGAKQIDLDSRDFVQEFEIWLKKRNEMSEIYTLILKELGFYFEDEDCAEIGKGEKDSVVSNFNTTIISPYYHSFHNSNSILIHGDLKVYQNKPYIIKQGNYERTVKKAPLEITTFMTQNPYFRSSIEGWDLLHNTGNGNIIVGMFGSASDKDRLFKKRQLNALKEKLINRNIIEEEIRVYDNYYYVVGSEVKKLERILSHHR